METILTIMSQHLMWLDIVALPRYESMINFDINYGRLGQVNTTDGKIRLFLFTQCEYGLISANLGRSGSI
jgi:hypothetical protein